MISHKLARAAQKAFGMKMATVLFLLLGLQSFGFGLGFAERGVKTCMDYASCREVYIDSEIYRYVFVRSCGLSVVYVTRSRDINVHDLRGQTCCKYNMIINQSIYKIFCQIVYCLWFHWSRYTSVSVSKLANLFEV